MWIQTFSIDFFLTFLYQYLAFKTRKPLYLLPQVTLDLQKAKNTVKKEGLDYLVHFIEEVEAGIKMKNSEGVWEIVRNIPRSVAQLQGEFIVQMIDEFQFLTNKIYWDQKKKSLASDMAGGYLSTAESKIAPLLVSGSWVGWLMHELIMLLPARFKFHFLQELSEDEITEMIFRYSHHYNIRVTDKTAYAISNLTEGSPFYIGSLFRSTFPQKKLYTKKGVLKTLQYEILRDEGEIKSTWMEYVRTAFGQVNEKNSKRIVLYLCQNRHREVTRKEINDELKLKMDDSKLEKKLDALVKADIIQQGSNHFRYQGVKDNIFDKVFRGVYQEEIQPTLEAEIEEIIRENEKMYDQWEKKYHEVQGKLNHHKGLYVEYWILDQFRSHVVKKQKLFKKITQNLPDDFEFCPYERVWSYHATPEYSHMLQIDLFARADKEHYSVIGEVKNRDSKKFSLKEAQAFKKKLAVVKEAEKIR